VLREPPRASDASVVPSRRSPKRRSATNLVYHLPARGSATHPRGMQAQTLTKDALSHDVQFCRRASMTVSTRLRATSFPYIPPPVGTSPSAPFSMTTRSREAVSVPYDKAVSINQLEAPARG
jgi:hypothetical protein